MEATNTLDQPPAVQDEFEKTPVPAHNLKGWKSFVGMFAGEHAAGTEFMIGPLFVVHGVTPFALIFGLIAGNILAVLSWTFITAPVATKTRLTLYYQLEKICGIRLVNIYNIANGLMFCFLAGAMIAVSATAIGIPFNVPMPGLNDWFPNSIGWLIAVFCVGAVISVVAMKGYSMVARFANIASPWMVLVFLACGILALRELNIQSFADFWNVAGERIWTGMPLAGATKFTFWHITFFAWFCNMAMHIGMADMSIFRFARKWQMGASSFAGMFVGHFMAWVAASLLYAVQIAKDPGNTGVAPGPMAYGVAGIAGAVCVIIAGWTTANPTIYRAGLAFQTLFPKLSRARVSLIAGGIATVGGCFPALVMKLLDFVALYGLILMPMGTVIIIDHYLLPRLGMLRNYAEHARKKFYLAPGITWLLTLLSCVLINQFMGIEIFFLGLPGWFMAAILYIILSKWYQQPKTTPA